MTQRKPTNFDVPLAFVKGLDVLRETDGLHQKQKWIAISAAILRWAETDEAERRHYLNVVSSASLTNTTFEALWEKAVRGEIGRVHRDESVRKEKRSQRRSVRVSKPKMKRAAMLGNRSNPEKIIP